MQPVTVTVVISCHQFWPLVLWPMAPLSSRREGPPPGQCCFSFLFWSAGSFSVLAWLTLALLVSSLPLFSILSLINHHFASLSNILYDSSTLNTSKMKYVLNYRVDQKKVCSQKKWPELLWNPSEREKVGVFRKIQHKCCRIGTKPFKISGEMAKKNKLEVGNPLEKCVKIHCIRFVPFLEGGCQLQLHVS